MMFKIIVYPTASSWFSIGIGSELTCQVSFGVLGVPVWDPSVQVVFACLAYWDACLFLAFYRLPATDVCACCSGILLIAYISNIMDAKGPKVILADLHVINECISL